MKLKLALAITAFVLLSNPATAQRGPSIQMDAVFINSDPYPAESGEDAEIRFKVVNRGDTEAEDVEVQVVDSYPFRLKPDTRRNYSLGEMVPGQEYQITTDVLVAEDSPDGTNHLAVRLNTGNFTREVDVPVEVQSEDIELNVANLKTSPSVLRPDSEGNKMTLEVVNNGEKSAENVVVELRLPKGFEKTSSFSTRQALGTLDAGEVKKAEFVFDTSENTSSGMRTVPAEIRYSASDNTAEISQDVTFDLHVSGRPQFRVLSSESDLSVGSDGRIEIKVKNFGSVTSDSTRVRVLDNSDLPFSFESSNRFLGTLEPGQSGSVVFETSVEGGATPKEYLLDFEIRGVRDSEVFVEEEVRSVEVDDSSSSRDIPVLPLGAAVILVAAGLSYRFRDRLPI